MAEDISFSQRCYALLNTVPEGRVTTYKLMAEALGTKGYRAVGMAMNKNPDAPQVPCHRVVSHSGHLHGYAFGLDKKRALLASEGVAVSEDYRVIDLEKVLHRF